MNTKTEPMQVGEQSETNFTAPLEKLNFWVDDIPVSKLIAQFYETAPMDERSRLLEHLMQPLGVLSRMAVANGIFANMLFRSGLRTLHVRPEDAQYVRLEDVTALVDYVLQVSVESVEALLQMVMACSVMPVRQPLRSW